MGRGACSALLMVLDTQGTDVTTVVADFAEVLRNAGFHLQTSEDQMALLQEAIVKFQRDSEDAGFPGFDLTHPDFQEHINFFCLTSEDDLTGPATALTFATAFAQSEVLTSASTLTATGEAVLVPLAKELASSLAPYLIELDEELDWMTAWEALNRGSSPLGKLLYLSPAAQEHPGARMCRYWGTVEPLPKGGLLIRPPMNSWVALRHCYYPAPSAKIVWSRTEHGIMTEIYSFDPLTAPDDLFATQGGVTINGINWPSVDHIHQLTGRQLAVAVETEPELCESVFWHHGDTLEIQRLSISCTAIHDGQCKLRLTASLLAPAGDAVEAVAVLLATIEEKEGSPS